MSVWLILNEQNVWWRDKQKIDETIHECERILKPFGILRIVKKNDMPSYKALNWDIEGFNAVADLFSILLLLIVAIEVYSFLSRIISNNQREIGILKAMGFSNRPLRFHMRACIT